MTFRYLYIPVNYQEETEDAKQYLIKCIEAIARKQLFKKNNIYCDLYAIKINREKRIVLAKTKNPDTSEGGEVLVLLKTFQAGEHDTYQRFLNSRLPPIDLNNHKKISLDNTPHKTASSDNIEIEQEYVQYRGQIIKFSPKQANIIGHLKPNSIVYGNAGSGKTLLAEKFITHIANSDTPDDHNIIYLSTNVSLSAQMRRATQQNRILAACIDLQSLTVKNQKQQFEDWYQTSQHCLTDTPNAYINICLLASLLALEQKTGEVYSRLEQQYNKILTEYKAYLQVNYKQDLNLGIGFPLGLLQNASLIIIDEFQQFSPSLLATVAKLGKPIVLFGDPNQAVAVANQIGAQKVGSLFPGITSYYLDTSYRVPQSIATFANTILEIKTKRFSQKRFDALAGSESKSGNLFWCTLDEFKTFNDQLRKENKIISIDSALVCLANKDKSEYEHRNNENQLYSAQEILGLEFCNIVVILPEKVNSQFPEAKTDRATALSTAKSVSQLNFWSALYVAITRAQNNLFLVFQHEKQKDEFFSKVAVSTMSCIKSNLAEHLCQTTSLKTKRRYISQEIEQGNMARAKALFNQYFNGDFYLYCLINEIEIYNAPEEQAWRTAKTHYLRRLLQQKELSPYEQQWLRENSELITTEPEQQLQLLKNRSLDSSAKGEALAKLGALLALKEEHEAQFLSEVFHTMVELLSADTSNSLIASKILTQCFKHLNMLEKPDLINACVKLNFLIGLDFLKVQEKYQFATTLKHCLYSSCNIDNGILIISYTVLSKLLSSEILNLGQKLEIIGMLKYCLSCGVKPPIYVLQETIDNLFLILLKEELSSEQKNSIIMILVSSLVKVAKLSKETIIEAKKNLSRLLNDDSLETQYNSVALFSNQVFLQDNDTDENKSKYITKLTQKIVSLLTNINLTFGKKKRLVDSLHSCMKTRIEIPEDILEKNSTSLLKLISKNHEDLGKLKIQLVIILVSSMTRFNKPENPITIGTLKLVSQLLDDEETSLDDKILMYQVIYRCLDKGIEPRYIPLVESTEKIITLINSTAESKIEDIKIQCAIILVGCLPYKPELTEPLKQKLTHIFSSIITDETILLPNATIWTKMLLYCLDSGIELTVPQLARACNILMPFINGRQYAFEENHLLAKALQLCLEESEEINLHPVMLEQTIRTLNDLFKTDEASIDSKLIFAMTIDSCLVKIKKTKIELLKISFDNFSSLLREDRENTLSSEGILMALDNHLDHNPDEKTEWQMHAFKELSGLITSENIKQEDKLRLINLLENCFRNFSNADKITLNNLLKTLMPLMKIKAREQKLKIKKLADEIIMEIKESS